MKERDGDRATDENGVKSDGGEIDDVGYCNTIQHARNNRSEQPRIPAAVRGKRVEEKKQQLSWKWAVVVVVGQVLQNKE